MALENRYNPETSIIFINIPSIFYYWGFEICGATDKFASTHIHTCPPDLSLTFRSPYTQGTVEVKCAHWSKTNTPWHYNECTSIPLLAPSASPAWWLSTIHTSFAGYGWERGWDRKSSVLADLEHTQQGMNVPYFLALIMDFYHSFCFILSSLYF
jgi:hypothetical protein